MKFEGSLYINVDPFFKERTELAGIGFCKSLTIRVFSLVVILYQKGEHFNTDVFNLFLLPCEILELINARVA